MTEHKILVVVTNCQYVRADLAHLPHDVRIHHYVAARAWEAVEYRMKRGTWVLLAYGHDVTCPMSPDVVLTPYTEGLDEGRDIRLADWHSPILRVPEDLPDLYHLCERRPAHAK